MLRALFLPVGLLAAMIAFTTFAQASDTCQRATGGNCKTGQQSPPKLKSGTSTKKATQPLPTGNHKGRDAYTPAQREKFMAEARELCRKKYGAPSRVYRIDYKKNMVWCEPPSY